MGPATPIPDPSPIAEARSIISQEILFQFDPSHFDAADGLLQLSAILLALIAAWAIHRAVQTRSRASETGQDLGPGQEIGPDAAGKPRSTERAPKLEAWLSHIGMPFLATALLGATNEIWAMIDNGQPKFWVQTAAYAALWLIVLRTAAAAIGYMMPKGRLSAANARTLSSSLWALFALWYLGALPWAVERLDSARIAVGKSEISAWGIISALFWVAILAFGALWLSKVLEHRLMGARSIDMNVRIVLSNVMRTGLVIGSVLIALPIVGVDLGILSVFGGALGVGLGFGLQKIASNYVSGFIILLDHSIRVGDRLTVNGFTGQVRQITARYVALDNTMGASALIPNETFVSNTFVSESFAAKKVWRQIDVQISYGSDLNLALKLLTEACAAQPRIDQSATILPAVTDFGADGIDLGVGFWLTDPENGFMSLKSAILLDIWNRFNEAGIEFPFPQRDVRIVSAPGSSKPIAGIPPFPPDARSDSIPSRGAKGAGQDQGQKRSPSQGQGQGQGPNQGEGAQETDGKAPPKG